MDVALLATIQALYYLPTGMWPLVHMRSFLWITGPKTDLWLVQTVGVLIVMIGSSLLMAGWNRTITTETVVLALGSAIGLAVIEVVFVSRSVISRIYAVDAVLEGVLISCWVAALAT